MDTVLGPLETAVSWIMIQFHTLFSPIFGAGSGITWTLSIVGLVVVIRILLIPLFVKQIRSSRGLQLLQPELQALQAKYKGKSDPESRQKQSQEMMELYRKNGTNPLASCLPILLQAPIFFALFRVLNGISTGHARGVLTADLVKSARSATFLGAPIPATFVHASDVIFAGHAPLIRAVTLTLIVLMSLTTFTTQRQLMRKNMPQAAMTGTFAQQQKILLYVFPLIFAISGINFPIGVLLYWLTTNVWTMGQQFYVIRRMPAPGSMAEAELQARRAAGKGGRKGAASAGDPSAGDPSAGDPSAGDLGRRDAGSTTSNGPPAAGEPAPRAAGQRQQPRKQPRTRRRPPRPAALERDPDAAP